MLKILSIDGNYKPKEEDTGSSLFNKNIDLNLVIEAPLYWWISCEYEHSSFDFPKYDRAYCFDAWPTDYSFVTDLKRNISGLENRDRALMQVLPLSTILVANMSLSYQQVCKICQDYGAGEYDYQGLRFQWPAEREWCDFCETLLDIRGIRDIVGGNYYE